MMILALDHVQLVMPVGGEDAARRFYAGLLGLVEIVKPPELAVRGGCWFGGEHVQLHLSVDTGFAPASKAHPALLVSDLPALWAALAAEGVRLTPDDAVPGVRRFYALDPFGNRLEFIQNGDGFSQHLPD
jgi:catechol 2,3-dioxygenase-like lactoylglutathione lyase family enzyme